MSNKHTYGKNKSRPLSHTIYEKQQQIDCIPVDYSVSHQDSDHEGALQNKYYGKKGGRALGNNNILANKTTGKWED